MSDFHSRTQLLLERFTIFSESLISLAQRLPKTQVNRNLLNQLIRSGTAVGAIYNEAMEAESGKDFLHKSKLCKKEAKETKYWLRLLRTNNENNLLQKEIDVLYKESDEILRIFSAIVSKFKN